MNGVLILGTLSLSNTHDGNMKTCRSYCFHWSLVRVIEVKIAEHSITQKSRLKSWLEAATGVGEPERTTSSLLSSR